MDLESAVHLLSSEMGVELETRDVTQLEMNAIGARLYSGNTLYGTIALVTDEEGTLRSAAYLGKYPGQTDVGLPVVGVREKVVLNLDTRQVPYFLDNAERIVRVDHNDVVFLGHVYDGWDAWNRNHFLGPAANYAEMLDKD